MDRKLNEICDRLDKITRVKEKTVVNKDDPKFVVSLNLNEYTIDILLLVQKNGIYLLIIEASAFGHNLLYVLFTKLEQKNGILLP